MFYTERSSGAQSEPDEQFNEDEAAPNFAESRSSERSEAGDTEELRTRVEELRKALLKVENDTSKTLSRVGKLLGTSASRTRTREVELMKNEYESAQKALLKAELTEKRKSYGNTPEEKTKMSQELTAMATQSVIDEKKNYLQEKADSKQNGWVRKNIIERYKKLGFKKKLLISGGLLAGAGASAALGQVWLSSGFLAARRGLGTLGASIGTEAVIEKSQQKELAKKGLDDENIFADFEKEMKEQALDSGSIESVLRLAMDKKRVSMEKGFREQTQIRHRQGVRKVAMTGMVGGLVGSGMFGEAASKSFGYVADKCALDDALRYCKSLFVGVAETTPLEESTVVGTSDVIHGETAAYDGPTAEPLNEEPNINIEPEEQGQVEASSEQRDGFSPAASEDTEDVPRTASTEPEEAASVGYESQEASQTQPEVEVLDEEMSPEEASETLSKYEIKKGDTLWGSVQSLFAKNAEQFGFEGQPEDVNKWASRQAGKAIRGLTEGQGGQLSDLIHPGDSVSLSSAGKVIFEPTSGIQPGQLADVSGVDADEVLRVSVAATRDAGVNADEVLQKSVAATQEMDSVGSDISQEVASGESSGYIDAEGQRHVKAEMGGKAVDVATDGDRVYSAGSDGAPEPLEVPQYIGQTTDGKDLVFNQDPETGFATAQELEPAADEEVVEVQTEDAGEDFTWNRYNGVAFQYDGEGNIIRMSLTAERTGINYQKALSSVLKPNYVETLQANLDENRFVQARAILEKSRVTGLYLADKIYDGMASSRPDLVKELKFFKEAHLGEIKRLEARVGDVIKDDLFS